MINSFISFGDESLSIAGFSIQYYALCILTGIILACILGIKEAKRFNIAPSLILDGVLICVPLAIVGARLYYVLFSDGFVVEGDFGATLLKIIGYDVNNGTFELRGLAITGGIIVAILFVIIYCKVRKINVWHVFDLLAPGLLIGQVCGRWGNFFNHEAHGPSVNDSPSWIINLVPDFIMKNMDFVSKTEGYRDVWHPTFFYESVWNFIALVIILISRRINKKQRVGDSIAFYLMWYGLGRGLLIEPLRTDPLLFSEKFGLQFLMNTPFDRVNIVISLAMALIGLVWLVLKHTVFKEPYYIETQKEIKENKIDGVIYRIDETMITVSRLIENTYYYTAKEKLGIELTDEQTKELVSKDPQEYFTDEEALKYFYEYFESHASQTQVVLECKELFKKLFKNDYYVAVVTKYSKNFAEEVLKLLGITTYVSIIIDKDLGDNLLDIAFSSIKESKNKLVISSLANDILYAKNHNARSCLIYFGNELDEALEYEPTFVVTKESQLDDIIIV